MRGSVTRGAAFRPAEQRSVSKNSVQIRLLDSRRSQAINRSHSSVAQLVERDEGRPYWLQR